MRRIPLEKRGMLMTRLEQENRIDARLRPAIWRLQMLSKDWMKGWTRRAGGLDDADSAGLTLVLSASAQAATFAPPPMVVSSTAESVPATAVGG
jgi:hypothetical protein